MASFIWPPNAPASGSAVTSLNGLTGAVILAAGSGISLTPAGQTITIAATGSTTFPLLGPNGSQAAPTYSFSAHTGTGLFIDPGALDLGISVDGNYSFEFGATRNVSFTPLSVQAGTAASPGLTLTGAGLWRSATNTLNFSTAGVDAGHIDPSQNWSFVGDLYAPNGTASLPAYSFTSETNSGWYRRTAGTLSASILGNLTSEFGANSFTNTASAANSFDTYFYGKVISGGAPQGTLHFFYTNATDRELAQISISNTSSSTAASAGGAINLRTSTPAGTMTTAMTIDQSQNASVVGNISAANFSGSSSGSNTGDQTITLTGDVTGSGTGSFAATLATVATGATVGSSTSIPTFTFTNKGLVTSASGNVVIAPAGTLSGTTLNSTVVTSSLTSVGTLGSLTVTGSTTSGTFIPSSSSAPTNGMYLSASNKVALSTNSLKAIEFDANQNIFTQGGRVFVNYETKVPLTGDTISAAANLPGMFVNPAGTLSTLTIKLPPSPIDGQKYFLVFSQLITTITFQDAGGTTGNCVFPPAGITSTGRISWFYNASTTKWYPIV